MDRIHDGARSELPAPSGQPRRQPGLPGLTLFGMAAIGPGSVMAVWGAVSLATQGASMLAYGVGLVAMLAVAQAYARLARELPSAGSAFAFATPRLGPAAGFAAGWLILLDYLLVPSLSALFGAVALQSPWPAAPPVGFVVLLIGSAVACNLAGVRVNLRWLLVSLIATLGVVGWFSVLALQRLGVGEGPMLSWAPLWLPGGPPMSMGRHLRGAGLASAVSMTMVAGTFPAALTGQSAMARVMMAMARAGMLPSRLAHVHALTSSPALATLLGGAGALGVALIFADQMTSLVKLVSLGAMGAFALVELSLLRSACEGWRAFFSHRLAPAFGLAVLGLVVGNMDSASHLMALAWLSAGALVYASRARRGAGKR
jgi:amino acid transporter